MSIGKHATKPMLGRLLSGIAASARAAWPAAAPLARRPVWRISGDHPLGAWVDPAAEPMRARAANTPPEDLPSGWLSSSMDLLDGSEIVEEPETAPAVLYDEFLLTRAARDDI